MSNPFDEEEEKEAKRPVNPFDDDDDQQQEQEREAEEGGAARDPFEEDVMQVVDIEGSLSFEEAAELAGEAWFREEFDVAREFTHKLPASLDEAFLRRVRDQQYALLEAVSSRLYDKVQASSDAMMLAMKKIEALHLDSAVTVQVCRNSRQQLSTLDSSLVSSGLGLLRKARRRHRLRQVLELLVSAQEVVGKSVRIKSLVEEGDYPSALALADELQSVAEHSPIRVLRALAADAGDLGEKMEERLSNAMERVCAQFSHQEWERVLTSFQLMGGPYAEPRAIAMRAQKQCIRLAESSAITLARTYVMRDPKNRAQAEEIHSAPLKTLAGKLKGSQLLECVHQVYGQLCIVMRGHAQMSLHPSPVGAGLKKVRGALWDECQARAVNMIKTRAVLQLRLPQLLHLRRMTHTLLVAGQAFCGAETCSDALQDVLGALLGRFFKSYHKSRLKDLVSALEQEQWEPLHVARGYGATDVKEIRHFLREERAEDSPVCDWEADEWENPMGAQGLLPQGEDEDEEDEREDSRFLDETAEDSALLQDRVEDDADDSLMAPREDGGAVDVETVSFAAVTAMRYTGRYMQLQAGMPEIATKVWKGIKHLGSYHLYATYYLFVLGHGIRDPRQVLMSPTMRKMLSFIHHSLIQEGQVLAPDSEASSQSEVWRGKAMEFLGAAGSQQAEKGGGAVIKGPDGLLRVRLPPQRSEGTLRAAQEVGRVSVGLAGQLWYANGVARLLRDKVIPFLPSAAQRGALKWIEDLVTVSEELNALAWEGCAERLLPQAATTEAVLQEAWAKNGTDRPPANYQKAISTRLKAFAKELEVLGHSGSSVKALWNYILSRVMDILLVAYGKVKRCSDDGRTLMLLDFRTLISDLEKVSPIQPLPGVEKVRNYIQAYFFKESVMDWVVDYHYQYSLEQLQGLVAVAAAGARRRDRQAMLARLEELKQ